MTETRETRGASKKGKLCKVEKPVELRKLGVYVRNVKLLGTRKLGSLCETVKLWKDSKGH